MLLKYTEYEILSFLKYDDLFLAVAKRQGLKPGPPISALSSTSLFSSPAINPAHFKVGIAAVGRSMQLCSVVARLNRGLGAKAVQKSMSFRNVKQPLKPI